MFKSRPYSCVALTPKTDNMSFMTLLRFCKERNCYFETSQPGQVYALQIQTVDRWTRFFKLTPMCGYIKNNPNAMVRLIV